MIITLTSVLGNGRHRGKSVREIMDSDPEYILWWRNKVYGLRFDTDAEQYLGAALVKHEAKKRLVFEEVEEDSPF